MLNIPRTKYDHLYCALDHPIKLMLKNIARECWSGCWSGPVIVKLTNCPCLPPTETALHWVHSLSFEPHKLINYILQHAQGRAIGKTISFSSKCTPCFLGTCYTFIKSRLTMRTSLHKCIAIVEARAHMWAHAPCNHPLTPARHTILPSPIGDSLLWVAPSHSRIHSAALSCATPGGCNPRTVRQSLQDLLHVASDRRQLRCGETCVRTGSRGTSSPSDIPGA